MVGECRPLGWHGPSTGWEHQVLIAGGSAGGARCLAGVRAKGGTGRTFSYCSGFCPLPWMGSVEQGIVSSDWFMQLGGMNIGGVGFFIQSRMGRITHQIA